MTKLNVRKYKMNETVLKHSEIFLKVVETSSISRAADLLGFSKGFVSQAMSELEGAIGTELLDRSTRPLRITNRGLELYQLLCEQRKELNDLMSRFKEVSNQKSSVSIGFIESLFRSVGRGFCSRIRKNCHSLTLTFGSVWELERLFFEKKIDTYTSWYASQLANTISIPVLTQPILIAYPKSVDFSAAASNKELFRKLSLMGYPVIVHPNFSFSPHAVTSLLDASGYSFVRKYRVDGVELQLELVAQNFGWCMTQPICFFGAEHLLSNMNVVPLFDKQRTIYLITRKTTPTDATSLALNALKEELRAVVLPTLKDAFKEASDFESSQLDQLMTV